MPLVMKGNDRAKGQNPNSGNFFSISNLVKYNYQNTILLKQEKGRRKVRRFHIKVKY